MKEIWSSMIHNNIQTDEVFAKSIEKKIGEVVKINTLVTTRRRLRQRLEVLHFILDVVPNNQKDEHGDSSILARIKNEWGLDEKDVPTLRHIAALARAAQGEGTLAWALFSRLLIDKSESKLDEVEKQISPLLECQKHIRINKAKTWMNDKKNKQILKHLKKEMNKKNIRFFSSPVWYLIVLREFTTDEVVKTLKPAPKEECSIRMIMDSLEISGKRKLSWIMTKKSVR
ncbi:MAG: hypothetical protein SCARUB_05086 [Candidatus Scalindua rubra]|uniref:Uncharacterized protein n=1 Tax=Candidatus Scalindua rubra TaxID=1872076 RepID=A0A1E3X4B3_9BACT|nr:MAG: hypothetical protein SCARUB_05086 [Candidatus Scalindua rubra]